MYMYQEMKYWGFQNRDTNIMVVTLEMLKSLVHHGTMLVVIH